MRHVAGFALVALTCLTFANPACAQQAAADEFNRDLQNVWDTMRPALQRVIAGQVQSQITSVNQTSGVAEISVRDYRGTGFSIQNAPGITQLAADRVGLRIPLQGAWGFEVEATVRVKLRLWFWRPTIDIPIKLQIDRLTLEVLANFDITTDPLRPTLAQVARPNVDFRVRLRSRNFLWNLLFSILSPIGDYFAHKLLDDALDDVMPQLAALQGFPGPVPADGAPPLTDSGAATPFAQIAQGVDAKILADHTPHGMILSSWQDTDDLTTWEEAYKNGGGGNVGSVTRYHSGGDSAIWTGHYLASQAFRYDATNGDPAALAAVQKTLGGIAKLFAVNGDTGLLSRNAAPTNSQVGQTIAARNNPYIAHATINGVDWIGRPGAKGITRDQYSGVVLGLSVTYDLVPDPAVRAEVKRIQALILDYLIPRDWIITEDRPPLDAGNGSRGPLFWLGIVNQKLWFLLDGMRMHPGNTAYVAEFNRSAPLVGFAWMHAWTSTFGFDHYYKYNLTHSAYYNYFRLETDQARWQEMNRAYRILRRYIGHHRNAHFDLIYTAIDPSARAVFLPAVREELRQFLQRHHREIAPAVIDLSNVVWQTFTFTGYSNPSAGAGGVSASVGSTTVQVPSEPLNFQQRKFSGNFIWQRDPFSPATPGQGSAKSEKHGLDVVLPYWMGRVFGAF